MSSVRTGGLMGGRHRNGGSGAARRASSLHNVVKSARRRACATFYRLIKSARTKGGFSMPQSTRTLDQFDINGRSALVTGGASGLGLAYAEAMAEAGAKVTIADIDRDGGEREAARLRAEGYDVRAAVLDVVDREATGRVFAAHAAA